MRACEKRPVPSLQLEAIVDAAETYLVDAPERERTTREIGELIMKHLKGLDTVAYIRFASVYRDFKDVREFKEELEGLLAGAAAARRRSEQWTVNSGQFPAERYQLSALSLPVPLDFTRKLHPARAA